MELNKLLNHKVSRRDFLKMAGKAALGLGAVSGLESLVGCASLSGITLPDATREEVAKIKWDCNPILPIPENGCYTGTNDQTNPGAVAWMFKVDYGIQPTFTPKQPNPKNTQTNHKCSGNSDHPTVQARQAGWTW